MEDSFTRRGLFATAGAFALAAPVRAADKEPVFDDSEPTRGVAIPSVQHLDEMAAAPLIQKKVNKLWNDSPTIKEPNALQFTPKGTLLILDQVDPNKVFEVTPSDGKIMRTVQTESIHGSGITIDGSGNWIITSTKALQGPPVTLKVDPQSGKTLQKWVTPGWGFLRPGPAAAARHACGNCLGWPRRQVGRQWPLLDGGAVVRPHLPDGRGQRQGCAQSCCPCQPHAWLGN